MNKLNPSSQLQFNKQKILTFIFYGAIGLSASLSLALIDYWGLRLNSSIASLIDNTKNIPLYFWPYVILTFATIILFGLNASLFVFHWRKFGFPKFKNQAGALPGSMVSLVASACPVCGSTILSAIGLAGGLASLPLAGLELKALSFILVAISVLVIMRGIRQEKCADGVCPDPKDHMFHESDKDTLAALAIFLFVISIVGWNMLKSDPILNRLNLASAYQKPPNTKIQDINAESFQSEIKLGDSILRLVENGVIDPKKFTALYENRGGLPAELRNILTERSDKPILLTRDNANIYLNLFWPLGLANYMEGNNKSPVNSSSLFNFASTGGWTLGKEQNGGAYFNKFKIVQLTKEQEDIVIRIASNSYRPCCDNSAFFQDCNHGSALLGLLELGASQGLSEDRL